MEIEFRNSYVLSHAFNSKYSEFYIYYYGKSSIKVIFSFYKMYYNRKYHISCASLYMKAKALITDSLTHKKNSYFPFRQKYEIIQYFLY